MKDITQTREAIAALAAIIIRTKNDLSDGKISIAEGIGFLSDFGVLRAGIQGISEVPAELQDLDPAERDVLLSDIKVALTNAGLSHRIADAAEKILGWAYNTVTLVVDIRTLPPAAVPA